MPNALERELEWWRERHAFWLTNPPKGKRWFTSKHNTMAQHAAEQVAQLEQRAREQDGAVAVPER